MRNASSYFLGLGDTQSPTVPGKNGCLETECLRRRSRVNFGAALRAGLPAPSRQPSLPIVEDFAAPLGVLCVRSISASQPVPAVAGPSEPLGPTSHAEGLAE